MENIKVLIVDDQRLMRDGLKTILDLEENIEVIGTASNGQEAIEFCKDSLPDLILMDIRMPIINGVEATKILKGLYPKIKILILTTFNDEEYIVDALAFGAIGYILKDIDGDELINTINNAAKGSIMLPSDVAIKLVNRITKQEVITKKDKDALKDFSEREIEIAKLIAAGLNNKQISETLYISIGTVKNYITNIYSKLGTSDRMAVALTINKALKE